MNNDDDGWREEVGRVLTVLRTACDLKQDDLAKKTGVPSNSISDYERGKMIPGLRVLERLLKGMGLSFHALQEAQGFLGFVTQERLGATRQSSRDTETEKANSPSSVKPYRLALRQEIDWVAGATGKNVGQLIRLTLLLLCQLGEASDVRAADESSDRHGVASDSGRR